MPRAGSPALSALSAIGRLAVLALLLLAACGAAPRQQAAPALWEVTGPGGERGWLFGTVHALPPALAWQTPAIEAALTQADRLVLEIAEAPDSRATQRAFLRLATTPGQPPLAARVPPSLRARAARLASAGRIGPAALARLEDWALALTLAQAAGARGGLEPASGVEAVLRRRGQPIEGLETAVGQLKLFDGLPASAQRALLAAIIAESADRRQPGRLTSAWAGGDIDAIARESDAGLLVDPRLRQALLVRRNRAWAARIDALLRGGARPFVAVGAAHVAGPDGLPVLLAARGWTVRRVQ